MTSTKKRLSIFFFHYIVLDNEDHSGPDIECEAHWLTRVFTDAINVRKYF